MAMALMMTVASVAMLCGCGADSIEGKWYKVSEDPLTALGGIEFAGDGTWSSDGINLGNWEKDGDRYVGNVLGLSTHEYTISEYNGYTVLYEDEYENPQFAKSADDAEAVYQLLYGAE